MTGDIYRLQVGDSETLDIPAEFIEKVLSAVKITHPGTHFTVDAAVKLGNLVFRDGSIIWKLPGVIRILEFGSALWGLEHGGLPEDVYVGRSCECLFCINPQHYQIKPSSAAENFSPSPLNLSQMEKGKFVNLEVKDTESEFFITLKDGTTIEIRQPV